jgi:hypothetical protein
MIRIGTTAAGALSALLALGVSSAASAQTAQPQDPSNTAQDPQGQDPQGNKKQAGQDQLDREKAALKDRVQEQINGADANIDALKKMSKSDKGQTRKRDDDLQKQVSDMRDRLKKDMIKIDKASMNDWPAVRPVVERDVTAMNTQLQRVAAITKVPLPQTGAANKQP